MEIIFGRWLAFEVVWGWTEYGDYGIARLWDIWRKVVRWSIIELQVEI